jgi:L-ascorbate metabolism protein UlaG (beta-lactamase superfamily)
LNGKEKRAFVSGDSGYFDGFKKIGERFGPFDVTFLETKQYGKKSLVGNIMEYGCYAENFNNNKLFGGKPVRRQPARAREGRRFVREQAV